jgi:hypothetical protein
LPLPEKPARSERDDVNVSGEFHAQACRELPREMVVTGQLQVGVAIVEIDVIDRTANLELGR